MATTLAKGDIAIVEVTVENRLPEADSAGFSFVLLKDVDATTVIHFTSTGFNSAGQVADDPTLNGAEGATWTWTSGQALTAGTVVRIYDNVLGGDPYTNQNYAATTTGSVVVTGDALAQGYLYVADQIFIYQGAIQNQVGNTPNLLFGFGFNGGTPGANGWNTSTPANGTQSQLPTSLIGYEIAFASSHDVGNYTGALRQDTAANLFAAITNDANWTFSFNANNDNVYRTPPTPSSYGFTVGAFNSVPTQTVNSGSTVLEGGTDAITSSELDFDDAQQADTAITYTITTAVSNGTLFKNNVALGLNSTFTQADINNNLITYTHNGGETSNASFGFSVSDGVGAAQTGKTFTITVVPVNDAPQLTGDLSATINKGQSYVLTTTDLNFSDPDDNASGVTFTVAQLTNGSIFVNNVQQNTFTGTQLAAGQVTFVHNNSQTTSASFAVSVEDGNEDNSTPVAQTFNLSVIIPNTAPTVANNATVTVVEAQSVTITTADLDYNDAEQADTAITYTITSAPTNGTLYRNNVALGVNSTFTQADINNSLITYTHNGAEAPGATFGFSVSDGAGGSVSGQTFNFSITPVNDAPTATGLTQSLPINEDAAAANLFTTAPTVQDGDSTSVTATLTLADPNAGSLTGGGFAATANPGEYTFIGTPAAVQTALASVQFTPAANYNGSTSVSVSITDGNAPGTTGTQPSGSVSIVVSAVNDAPTATGLTQSLPIDEDAAAANLFTTAPTVQDIDSTSVTATLTLADPGAGGLTGGGFAATANPGEYKVTGTPSAVQTALANVQFTPTANYNGTTSVSVSIADSNAPGTTGTQPSGSVSIVVSAINDAPTATGLTQSLPLSEDAAATNLFTTAPTVQDVDSTSVTATLTLADPNAGSLTGGGFAATANPGEYTFIGTPAAVQTALASVQFTPANNYNGSTSVSVSITDGNAPGTTGTQPSGSVSIVVSAVNDAPTATGLTQSLPIDEDAAAANLFTTAPTVQDIDSTSITATLTLTDPNAGSLTGGGFAATAIPGEYTFTGTPTAVQTALANVQFTPTANYNGTTSVSVSIADGNAPGTTGTEPSGSVSIVVSAINDAPTATGLTQSLPLSEDAAATNLFTTAPTVQDVDSTSVTATLTLADSSAGSLTGGGFAATAVPGEYTFTGTPAAVQTALASVQFTPAANYNGTTSVSVSITDSNAAGTTGTQPSGSVSIVVSAVNNAPTGLGLPANITVVEDVASNVDLSGITIADVDAGGGNITVTLTASAGTLAATSGGGVTVGGSGSALTLTGTLAALNAFLDNASNVIYTSAANASGNGAATITVTINDNGNTGGPANTVTAGTVTVDITPVNDAPTATGLTQSLPINEDAAATNLFTTAPTVLDVDSTSITATLTLTDPNAGSLTGGGFATTANPGEYTFIGTPAAVQAALTNVQFTPAANYNGTTSVSVSITDSNAPGTTGTQPSGSVFIVVSAVNDAPSGLGLPAKITVVEDVASNVDLSGITIADVDVGGGNITVTLTASAGTLAATSGGGVTVGGSGSALTLTGTLAALNAFLDNASNVIYTSAANASGNGAATITVTINDNGNTGGPANTVTAGTVTVDITPVNDAPSGQNKTITTNEDTAYTFKPADFGFSDIDGNSLAAVKITQVPGAGTLKLGNAVVFAGQSIAAASLASLTFTPTANANGTNYASIQFQVQDNGGASNGGIDTDASANTITFNVAAVNDAPTAIVASNVRGPIAENASTAAAIKFADLDITDVDGGNNVLSLSGADASLFQILGGDLYLKAGAKLDFETNPKLDVTVIVNDASVGGAIDAQKALSFSVTDIIESYIGNSAANTLVGTSSDETFIGNGGADRMTGGGGRDTFVFKALSDTVPGSPSFITNPTIAWQSGLGLRDVITDFTPGNDKIDLSAIDASTKLAGNQAFSFLGTGTFSSSPGSIMYRVFDLAGTANDRTIVYADVNGDRLADMQIELTGLKTLQASDFVL